MPYSTQDLSQMFGKAVQSLESNRQAINDLDGPNGNHGDNMVHNLKVVQQTLQAHSGRSPAEALNQAAQVLAGEGRGSASQHYADGLRQAASQLQGKQSLGGNDVAGLVQTLLGAVPATQAPFAGGGSGSGQAPASGTHQPHVKPPIGANQSSNQSGDLFSGGSPQQGQGGLSDLLGMMAGGGGQAPNLGGNQGGGSLLDLLGMAAGGAQQPQSGGSGSGGLDLGTVLNAGMAFMQAEQSGASTGQAALQALQAGLSGRNPLQSGSPRGASGGLIAQSILGMLTGGQ